MSARNERIGWVPEVTYVGYAERNSARDVAMHKLHIPAVTMPANHLRISLYLPIKERDVQHTPDNTRASPRSQTDR